MIIANSYQVHGLHWNNATWHPAGSSYWYEYGDKNVDFFVGGYVNDGTDFAFGDDPEFKIEIWVRDKFYRYEYNEPNWQSFLGFGEKGPGIKIYSPTLKELIY
jgi:hypothetical protein